MAALPAELSNTPVTRIRVPAGTYRLSLENLSWDTESPPPELCISLVSSADAGPLWAAEGEPDFFLDPVDVELPRGVQNGELALSFRCPQNHPGCVVLMSARLGIAPTPDRLT